MAEAKLVRFAYHYIGLSSDDKPIPSSDKRVADGAVFYEADTAKTFVFCQGQWYKKGDS